VPEATAPPHRVDDERPPPLFRRASPSTGCSYLPTRLGTSRATDHIEERTLDVLLGDGKLARRSGGFDQGAACALERV
jgi:hypothetical protein